MKKTLLTVMMLVALLASGTPAAADLAADEEGRPVAPPPPERRVTSEGFLIIGGDVRIKCESLLFTAEGDASGIQKSVEACTEAGFPPTAPGNEVTVLPDTGGTSFAALYAAALLLSGGVLLRRLVRWLRSRASRP